MDENNDPVYSRRSIVRGGAVIGAAAITGLTGVTASGVAQGPPEDPGERTIEWDGERGSEHASKDCAPDEQACWKWILTPGGQPSLEGVGDLTVTFEDGVTDTVSGDQQAEGAYHFENCRLGGGEIEAAEVPVEAGGPNSHLTISDVECVAPETVYWQVDFGSGTAPPEPPDYGDGEADLVMAAVGNSTDVTWNPSFTQNRAYIDTVAGSSDVDEWSFTFDDDDDPTSVTVDFAIPDAIDGDAVPESLHLAVFTRPPQDFDDDPDDEPPASDELDLDAQEYYTHVSDSYELGDADSLTIDLPT